MNAIHYVKGDATCPKTSGTKIIAHICNDCGCWGKGFVLAISKRWKEPERSYRDWYHNGDDFTLGNIRVAQATADIYVANMIGQKGIKSGSKGVPIRYEAVESCLEKLAEKALELKATVHMPRIGCGLAGGKWELIEPLIQIYLSEKNIEVYVYDYKE